MTAAPMGYPSKPGGFEFAPGETPHMDQLIRWLAANHAEQPLLSYPDTDGNYTTTLDGAAMERITAAAAAHYARAFAQQQPGGAGTGAGGGAGGFGGLATRVVAMVSASTLASYVSFVALQRLGLSVMLVSPRLAHDGYAHLLRVVGARVVLPGGGDALTAMRRVQGAYEGPLELVPMLDDDEVLAGLVRPHVDLPSPGCFCPGVIIHTGGTTGLPKPVPFRDLARLAAVNANDVATARAILATVPHFHVFGLATFVRCLREASHLSLLHSARPVTASGVWRALDATGAAELYTVPYVCKFFADAPGGLARLARLEGITAAGAALPDELGERMLAAGCRLSTMYGQTESGATMRPYGPGVGEWNWLTPVPSTEGFLAFEKVGDDMYHLVIKPGFPALRLSDRPDGSYGTKDLFRPHPANQPGSDTRAGAARWKFVGRQGDVIVLVTGENADPTPIELHVLASPLVAAALAFGAGHERLGLLVIPAVRVARAELLRQLAPALAAGNARVAAYARIAPDDVLVLPAGTPFPMTAKMTLQRPVMHRLFAREIAAHYAARDEARAGLGLHQALPGKDDVRAAVKRIVEDVYRNYNDGEVQVDDDTDFFSMGMDSMQSSLVRRRLLWEMPLPEGAKLPVNVVFEYPTVKLLSEHLLGLRQNEAAEKGTSQDGDPETVARAMVKKYVDLVAAADALATSNGATAGSEPAAHVVLLTGATGYLGAQLLALLLARPDVSRVYCLVRTRQRHDHEAASQRVRASLDNSLLSHDMAPASQGPAKLVCLSSDLAAADLGLAPADYREIRRSVTAVVHNAWSVNFNMRLQSFEPNVASVAHLLALGGGAAPGQGRPRTFVFVSSVAAVMGVAAAEERVYDWVEASPSGGYGQSKWAAEQICAAVAKARDEAAGSVRILRVGQVSGDASHGIWNPAEAVPATVQTALTMGVLPRMMEGRSNTLCWLPSDVTAAVITELTMADCGSLSVFHVSSPHTLRWNEDVLPGIEKAGVKAEIVPQQEWVHRLEQKDDVEANPPYKLIEHFRKTYGVKGSNGEKATNGNEAEMALTQSWKASPSLKTAVAVDAALVEKYVRFWLKYWAGEHRDGDSPKA